MPAIDKFNRTRHKLKVGREEAVRIGQKVYYDPAYCNKDMDHAWVRINGDRQQCYECCLKRSRIVSLNKMHGITEEIQANASAIKKVQNKREEIALSKMDDYDFDFDDE